MNKKVVFKRLIVTCLLFLVTKWLCLDLWNFYNNPNIRRDWTLGLSHALPGLNLPSNISDYYGLNLTHAKRVNTKDTYIQKFGMSQKQEVSILCWISTRKQTLAKAIQAKASWGRFCNVFLMMSDMYRDGSYPADVISLQASSHYSTLWARTQLAFQYINRTFLARHFDFVLKADDDTFVDVPNLRHFLRGLHPDNALYIGHPLKFSHLGTYMSGGGGYLLSQEAFQQWIGVSTSKKHQWETFFASNLPEDAAMGAIMNSIGAHFITGSDSNGKLAFTPIRMDQYHNVSTLPAWYRRANRANLVGGGTHAQFRCCSPLLITRHYVGIIEMKMRGVFLG